MVVNLFELVFSALNHFHSIYLFFDAGTSFYLWFADGVFVLEGDKKKTSTIKLLLA